MALYDVSLGKAVYENFTDSALISEVVDLLYDKYTNLLFRGMGGEGIITFQPENPFMKREIERGDCHVAVVEREKWKNEKFYKMTLRAEHETLVEVSKLLEKSFGEALNLCFSWPTIFEIQPKGMSKAVTALKLRDMLSVGGIKKKLYAVGDYGNDIEMLKAADVAVCPSNAIDEVKNICDLCLCDNDSGVIADLIEYIDKNTEV
jgi:HAD superfamily hydrolase (TIGR01484 family)